MPALSAPPRKPIPLRVKLSVALRTLGLREGEIDWSHEPALQLRAIRDDGKDYEPRQHDPKFIEIRTKAAHAHITFKDNGSGRGDITTIAHSRRVERKHDEHQMRMAQKKLGMNPAPTAAPKSRWSRRKMRRGG